MLPAVSDLNFIPSSLGKASPLSTVAGVTFVGKSEVCASAGDDNATPKASTRRRRLNPLLNRVRLFTRLFRGKGELVGMRAGVDTRRPADVEKELR